MNRAIILRLFDAMLGIGQVEILEGELLVMVHEQVRRGAAIGWRIRMKQKCS